MKRLFLALVLAASSAHAASTRARLPVVFGSAAASVAGPRGPGPVLSGAARASAAGVQPVVAAQAVEGVGPVPETVVADAVAAEGGPAATDNRGLADILDELRTELARKLPQADNDFYRSQGQEYVKIASPGMERAMYQSADIDRAGRQVSVPLPLFGQYQGRLDEKHDVVRLDMGSAIEYVAVPREQVTTLRGPYGHIRVSQALDVLTRGRLEFARGEKIRFRDEKTGLMRAGVYEEVVKLGKKGKKAAVLDEAGVRLLLPKNLVYKWTGGSPTTPLYNVEGHGMWAPFKPERGTLTGSFLHAAARLTSHPQFLAEGEPLRLKRVSDFVRTLVSPDMAAGYGELHGFWSFDQVLTIGLGVCRHLSTLAAAVLAEAGFNVKLAVYTAPGGNAGHAWLEIMLSDGELAVLDPMHGTVLSWRAVEQLAQMSAKSLSSLFYVQPGRTLF